MKQSLQLKIGQQLTMTPQLQQAIKLLQLSSLELRQEIQQTLYSNPLLEMEDETAESLPETPASQEDADPLAKDVIPTELPVDANWDDVYQPAPTSSLAANTPNIDAENFHSVTESLQDHLQWQLNLTQLSNTDQEIGATIIDAVTTDGRLSLSPAEIWSSLDDDEVELDEVIAVLHCIQQFDPSGVAASSLQECLSIQLNQFATDTNYLTEAKLLVEDYLPLVGNRDYSKLTKITQLATETIEGATALIQTLNPHPGDSIANNDVEYVVPDAVVTKQDDHWRVSLNNELMPKLSINQQYARLIRRADNSKDNTFLRNHLQEAKWFLRSIESRNETLLRVSSCIVKLQQEFLEHGAEAMKPMVLADIADRLELHESTISRVTTQKYLDTPQGIFELKYFFSSHVATSSGGECSSTAIRAILKKMISAENPVKPLSDSKLALLLQDQGIEIARRTVAKYREGINIPSSSERRQFNN